jgi:hypothetical protein
MSRRLALAAALLAPACGGKVVLDVGGGGAGGASASLAASSVAASSVAATTSSVATTGSGGGDPGVTCATTMVNALGSIEGEAVSLQSPLVSALNDTAGAFLASFGQGGLLFVRGHIEGGSFTSPEIWVRMPAGAPDAGAWLCDAQGETVTVYSSPEQLFVKTVLHTLRRRGGCPGVAVPGQVSYCDPASSGCPLGTFDGTIDGAPFHAGIDDAIGAAPMDEEIGDIQGGGMFQWDWSDPNPTGVLLTPAGFQEPGVLYCAADVSLAPTNAGEVVLSGLSQLGPCVSGVAVPGELEVCLGF